MLLSLATELEMASGKTLTLVGALDLTVNLPPGQCPIDSWSRTFRWTLSRSQEVREISCLEKIVSVV